MSGLITVEDYNSALLNYQGVFSYRIDCNIIKDYADENEFIIDGFLHFVNNGDRSQGYLRYYVDVNNPLWTGGYQSNNLRAIRYGYPVVGKLWVVLNTNNDDWGYFELEMCTEEFGERYEHTGHGLIKFRNNNFFMGSNKSFVFTGQSADFENYPAKVVVKTVDGETIEIDDYTIESYTYYLNKYIFELENIEELNPLLILYASPNFIYGPQYFLINQFKNPNFLNITGNLYIGKSNNKLTIKPFISGVKCKLSYLDKEETILLGDTQQVNIDLSQKTDLKDITLKVELAEGPNSNKETLTYKLPVNYQTVNNMATFRNELSNINGGGILRLGSHFTANYDEPIPINHDVIIYGNNKNINLTHGRFIIKEGINVMIQNTNFLNGDTTFLQKDNSTLQLNNCSFTHCTANNNEGLGSVVCCDIDLESLTLPNDFTTLFNDCSFTNCPGAVFHGGELTVNNSNYYLNDSSIMNVNAPYFLYQTDGSANITGSVFDVDMLENVYNCEPFLTSGNVTRYGTNAELIEVISACRGCLAPSNDEATINDITETNGILEDIHFCEAEQNANLSQCLFLLGEDAMINNQIIQDLQNPNNLNFTNNNKSHIFMKYYYPDIEGCVYISPETGFETKALCYGLSSTDYIYTHNVKITRTNWGTENIDNPLRRG